MAKHEHTPGRRLRAAGVSFKDRQGLLEHRSGRIATHYSTAQLGSLIAAVNRVCEEGSRTGDAGPSVRETLIHKRLVWKDFFDGYGWT